MVAQASGRISFLSVDGITQEYAVAGACLRVLEDVSFEISEGELVSLVGPSGCGKTTLLRIIAGLLRPTCGSVQLRRKEVLAPPHEVGFVFQFPTLLPWRNVEGNVLLAAEVHRKNSPQDIRDKAWQMLTELGLRGFEKSYPRNLSGGMQQRVALARAILLEPRLLLLDEPFGALDEPTRRELGSLLTATVSRHRLTCLFVSHDVEEAVFVANRVLVLSARPSKIVREVDVPLSLPRTLSTLSDEYFLRLVAKTRRVVFAGLPGEKG